MSEESNTDKDRINQNDRLKDLFIIVNPKQSFEKFVLEKKGRSLSSLEEELYSMLPEIKEENKQEFKEVAQKVLGNKSKKEIEIEYPTINRNLKIISAGEYQESLFERFKSKTERILGVLSQKYMIHKDYSSIFYHLLRHLSNVQGGESEAEILNMAENTFSEKKVLELGPTNGYFTYLLQKLGADVRAANSSKELIRIVDNDYNLIFSNDYFDSEKDSLSKVEISLEKIYNLLQDNGLTVHQMKSESGIYFGINLESLKTIGYVPLTQPKLSKDKHINLVLSKGSYSR